jgi:hypothetical protein
MGSIRVKVGHGRTTIKAIATGEQDGRHDSKVVEQTYEVDAQAVMPESAVQIREGTIVTVGSRQDGG